MAKRLLVAGCLAIAIASSGISLGARQGWVNATGSLAYKLSECGNVTVLATKPESNLIIAGVAGRGLWFNTDGTTWTRPTDAATSDRIINRPSWVEFDPEHPEVFWESGNYNGGGVYKTTDGGKTFKRLGDIVHNDFINVDFSDPERRTLLVGGHEQERTVHLSIDGGQTWRNVGVSLPANFGVSTHPLIINSQTFLVNSSRGPNNSGGIFRSIDGGLSWRRVSSTGPTAAPLRAANGVIYWAGEGRLFRSTDHGVTWLGVGQEHNIRSLRPVELPGGRLVAIGQSTLLISGDGGATWAPLGPALPYEPHGIQYSTGRKAFFIWRGDCKEYVPANAVMRLDIDLGAATPPRH